MYQINAADLETMQAPMVMSTLCVQSTVNSGKIVVDGCFDVRAYKVNPWTLSLIFICLSNSP